MSEPGLALCRLEDIPDRTGKGFTIQHDGKEIEILVVRAGDAAYGYINWCPHYGITLEWMQDKFVDLSGEFIQCSSHGARFRFEDGYCVWGPCQGEALEPMKVVVSDGEVRLRKR
jgi:nitrite reductase/ring-hydroxylating ferredoxin subunit